MTNLSDQIPFEYFTDELGETICLTTGNVEVVAILDFYDSLSGMARQYQYLQLEIASEIVEEHKIDQGTTFMTLTKRNGKMEPDVLWTISQKMFQTYTGSQKFIAGDPKPCK